MDGYIYNYATPSNPVVDITGTRLTLLLNFRDKNAAAATDHPASAVPEFGLIQGALYPPLSEIFTELWSVNVTNNQTAMQAATNVVMERITTLASGVSNIQGSLPSSGPLRALVLPAQLFLSYWLPNASFTFNYGALGAKWKLTFDIELFLSIDLHNWPSATVNPSVLLSNANISSNNFGADIDDAILTVGAFFSSQPTNIFQAQEGDVDSAPATPPDLSELTQFLNALSSAAIPDGFLQITPFIDSTNTLNLRLIHPVDPGPVLTTQLSFNQPSLGFVQPQVRAGTQATAIGSHFPATQATQAYLSWTDTVSGNITESDIQRSPGTPLTLTRTPGDGGNYYVVANLNPGTTYQFSVRDCDALTCTNWSNILPVTTTATNEVELNLRYDGENIGSVVPVNGSFTTPVLIPPNVPPGTYAVDALMAGQLVTTGMITVVAANAVLAPVLQVIDGATGVAYSGTGFVFGNVPVSIQGLNFNPGEVEIFIDSTTGVPFASPTADADGSFRVDPIWPNSAIGDHTILAQQGSEQATALVDYSPAQ